MPSLSASTTRGAPRRRTRSTRSHLQNQPPSEGLFGSEEGEAMDVEEEARERKKVARR